MIMHNVNGGYIIFVVTVQILQQNKNVLNILFMAHFLIRFRYLLSKTDVKSYLVTNKSNMNFNTVFIPNLMTAKISETCLYINTNKQCYDNNVALGILLCLQ